jgi:cytochrome c oxidase subunit 4
MADHSNWKRLGKGDLPTEDADVGLGHIVPIRTYNIVFVSLLILTGVTVWAASLQVSANTHLIVATLIATLKAAVVTFVFMHLWFEKKLLWIIVIYPIFILALMILGTTGDASVKRRGLPAHGDISFKKGRAFGVADTFIPEIIPEKLEEPSSN